MNKLEELEKMAYIVAKPWRIAVYTLCFLLILSISGNIYMFVKNTDKNVSNEATLSDSNHNMLSFNNE